MATQLKNNRTQAIPKDEDFICQRRYNACGFVLNISMYSFTKLGFGSKVWDAQDLDNVQAFGLTHKHSGYKSRPEARNVAATLTLLQYFEEQKMSFSEKNVIELGSGTGILGIVTALLGGNVTITDKPELLKQMEWNVLVNIPSTCQSRIKVRALSWGYDHMLFPSDYDYILCADIMYAYDSVPLILRTLLHLSNEKTIIYFASTMSFGHSVINSGYQILFKHFYSQLVYRNKINDVRVYMMTKII
ncbi:EEF1A lysine methyltransferase 3-like [Stegostoma tigrinum]|uniref:EEF1A lysine methyltransferase 3-like n=1 Tax=Stegostoma tigrinum TaxID=3053191 RepID=UPI0028703D93|nr:EEF1A lysine methyltransferase 3-like [Stegostoma tigrinum]